MKMLDLTNSVALNVSISGPLQPYSYTVASSFIDEYTLMVNITMQSQMAGDDEDLFVIYFDTSIFTSKYGATSKTTQLDGDLYKVPILPDVVAMIGGGLNNIMMITMILLISSNILLGSSSELLWGFMNTIQIMYFFPLLQLYYPDALAQILTYLSSSKMQIPMPPLDAFKSDVRTEYEMEDKINMPALNQRYQSIDYESTSIILT